MRVDEEKALQKAIGAISEYGKAHTQLAAFWNGVDSIDLPSIQSASFDSDVSFFKEASFVLSVIMTIAHKPHLVTRIDETIMRADQAGSLSNESFQSTMRDPALWKRKGGAMSPEYVHHTESNDEIRIYENIFIVMVVKHLEKTIHRYEEFYATSVKSIASERLTLDDDHVLEVFALIHKLLGKIERIKKTNFYKLINRGSTEIKNLHATNILKSDRLYAYVYRFYLDFSAYKDERELNRDLLSYFYILLLRALRKANFQLAPSSNRARTSGKTAFFATPKETRFFGNGLFLRLTRLDYRSFELSVMPRDKTDVVATHLLFINPHYSFSDYSRYYTKRDYKKYATVEALSVWALAKIDKTIKLEELPNASDQVLMEHYLKTKTDIRRGSRFVYASYCPSCRSQSLSDRDGIYTCSRCSSKYTLFQKEGEDSVFFLRIREE